MTRARAVPLPTPWLAGLIALTGLALFAWPGRSWIALVVVELVVLALFIADAVLCASPTVVGVQRDAPGALTLGQSASVHWSLENHSDRAIRVTMTDALWPSLRAERRQVTGRVSGRARRRMSTQIEPTRRGRFPLRDVTVRVTGPMRLAHRQHTRSLPGSIRVMPAFPSRDEVQRRVRIPRIVDSGARAVRVAGSSTEFDQLRDLRPDDEFRRVDWAATVRLQRPIVKQYRSERNQSVVVLLDNGRVMAGTVAEVTRAEHAMDAALSITFAATHLGDRCGLLAFDTQVRAIVPSASAMTQLTRSAEAMFLLDPEFGESAYLTAFSAATARFRRRSLYVVLTDLAEATVEEALLPALPVLTRRHLVVVAGVSDPDIAAWAEGPDVADGSTVAASDVYRQSAAIAAVQQRARSAARLRSSGAIVVDALPGRLGIDLVDTYLELKAAGRL
jgi:uncharacterized protein (DUF58 family)